MDMSVDEAIDATLGLKKVQTRLQTLHDLGLGYLTLGEPTPALITKTSLRQDMLY